MAEVYRYPQGVFVPGDADDPLNYVFAHHEDVLAEVMAQAIGRAGAASAHLGSHKDSGTSQISVDPGESGVDWTVWLSDDSLTGAYAIEFGRKGGRGNVGPLHKAFPEAKLGRGGDD